MRFRLRTLLIVLALGPPLIWAVWSVLAIHAAHIRAAVGKSPPGVIHAPTDDYHAELAKLETNPGSRRLPKSDARAVWDELERERNRYLEQIATPPETGN